MPHLESEILDFKGSTCFSSMDFVFDYWHLPFHPDSYTKGGIFGPKGVVASGRVLSGLSNATSYFQSTVESLFEEMRENRKAWLEDFNLHARDEKQLLDLIERFFFIYGNYGLYYVGEGIFFFSTSLKWCGRIIKPEFTLYTLRTSTASVICTWRSLPSRSRNLYIAAGGWQLKFPILWEGWHLWIIFWKNLMRSHAKGLRDQSRILRSVPCLEALGRKKHSWTYKTLYEMLSNYLTRIPRRIFVFSQMRQIDFGLQWQRIVTRQS